MCISFRFILLLYVQAHANVDVEQVYFEIGSARSLLPVSSLFVVCLIVPYRNPATPNETLVLMLFMINTQNPGFNPNLISDVVVLVFFNDSSLPLTKRFEPLEKANSVSLKKPKRLFLSIPIYALWNRAAEKVSPK